MPPVAAEDGDEWAHMKHTQQRRAKEQGEQQRRSVGFGLEYSERSRRGDSVGTRACTATGRRANFGRWFGASHTISAADVLAADSGPTDGLSGWPAWLPNVDDGRIVARSSGGSDSDDDEGASDWRRGRLLLMRRLPLFSVGAQQTTASTLAADYGTLTTTPSAADASTTNHIS
uniref:Uncharacterized protein n=1 Tax=Plectus sambesii TaxID=2011161 RepID=A0A914URC2_9BILA